ncbi:protein SCO1/2 [Desulfomicrobium macestii]|uniref:Protein SCO1/2 n=2 Tax=Desulfomicrobium TaxID=898 RepID=A0A8G2F7V5_DESNO|nr:MULTISPECIES: SCO family protein [Desulfomicrobium]MBE1426679.1 protein SCO1/2 [Desulfomicrobium macestii]SFL66817.1 protein SCO1/2 [Desulfomicrobium norvegicum]
MRSALLLFLLLVWPTQAISQSALHQAHDAAAAVTAHDRSTTEQAQEALHAGHGDAAPMPMEPLAQDPATDDGPAQSTHSGHAQPEAMPADHSGHGTMAPPVGNVTPASAPEPEHVHPAPVAEASIGVTEKLGEFIAAETRFFDEDGKAVTMGEIVDKPTIVVPIYFSCPNVCAIIQSSLTAVLPDVKLEPGVDFQVVSVSFDDTDTPELATRQKRNYMAAMDFKYPENGWRFLTGKETDIRMLMDSLGFGFRREGKDFLHPVVIMAVSPKGKIVRYLYGTKPLAFDLTMAATEAGREQIGLSVKRVLAYCFSYDPEGKRYAFNFMKITGTGILLILVVLLVSLMLAGRKKRTPRN